VVKDPSGQYWLLLFTIHLTMLFFLCYVVWDVVKDPSGRYWLLLFTIHLDLLVSWEGQVERGKYYASIKIGSIVFNVVPLEKTKC